MRENICEKVLPEEIEKILVEEKEKNMKQELLQKIEDLVTDYNEALLEGSAADLMKADEEIVEVLKEYSKAAEYEVFLSLKGTEDPMLEAIKMLTFTVKGKKDQKNEDGSITRVIIDKEKSIDLAKLNKFCGGIGKDKRWYLSIEKLNLMMTLDRAKQLGVSTKGISDAYLMDQMARQYDLGKTPASKTNMLKTLQHIVNAMVGEEYKALSRDVNYLQAIYSKKGRGSLKVACANHRQMRIYIAEIIHRIVLGKNYTVEYSRIKAK